MCRAQPASARHSPRKRCSHGTAIQLGCGSALHDTGWRASRRMPGSSVEARWSSAEGGQRSTSRCRSSTEKRSVNGERALRFRTSADAVAQRLGDEVVLVHIRTDKIFVLNRTGARVWELLCESLDRSAIQGRLLAEFEVGEVQLAAEIDALLTALTEEGLILPDDGT